MTSSVNFRMHFGKKDEWETILFPGHSIRLLDLKKEIAEKKKILLTNLDFDLQVTENETGKVFKDDNEYVPKNSSVIAKRIPIVNGSASLALKIRGAHGSGGTEIVMQTRAEEVPEEVSNLPVPSPQIEPVSVIEDKRMDEQEEIKGEESVNQDTDIYLKEERDYEMELSSAEMMTENELTMLNDIQTVDKSSAELASSVGGPRGRPGTGPLPDRYICPRCGKPGHFVGRCPTNNDPTYDKQRSQSTKLYAISTGSRKKVTSLDNIDTKTNTVIQRKDGSYEVIESSQSGLRRLEREGDLEAKVDPSEAPEHLRCVFSGQLLKEAVELPCCKKCVNDSAIRQYLLSGVSVQLKCPVCQVENLSPDSLLPRPDIRSEVENYILSKTGKEVLESSDTGGGNAKLPPPPPPPGPPPPKPMSGGFPPVDMYGMPLGPMGAPPGFMGGGPMMFPGGPMGPYGPQMGGPPGFFPPHIMPPHMMPPHMMDPRWGPYGFDPAMVMPPDMPPDEFMRMQQQQQQQRQGDGPHGDRFPRGPSGGRPNFQKRSNDDGRFRSFQPREFNRGRSRSASRQRSQPRSDSISGPAGDERSAPKLDKIKEVDEREEGRTKHQTRDEVRSRGEKDDGRGDRRGFDSRDRAGNIDTRDRDRERDRSRDRDRDRDRDKDKGDRGRERERGADTRDDRRDHNYDRDRDRDRGRERAREPRDDRQEKDRTRERDRERNSDRDRVRDQDRGEVKERDSEKDRKSKEKDKDRERDKDKEKVRDRDRDRDREKEHKDKRRDRDAPALDKYKEKTSELDPDDTERDNKKDEKKKRHREGRSDGDSDYNKTQKTLSSGRVVMTEESSKEKHRHR